MHKPIFLHAGINAGATALYIIGIAVFLSNTQYIFGTEEPKSFIVPAAMLSLFVLSAAVTGALVLGRPILWYLAGAKREALSLFIATIFCLALITLGLFFAFAYFG